MLVFDYLKQNVICKKSDVHNVTLLRYFTDKNNNSTYVIGSKSNHTASTLTTLTLLSKQPSTT